MQISGRIILPAEIDNREYKIYLRVQDTSIMDAPAITIAETVLNPPKKNGKHELEFDIKVETNIDLRTDYTLFVHLDLDQDKQLSTGDWMHQQSYAVIVRGEPVKSLTVVLRRIL